MQTSVFREILDRSISLTKLNGQLNGVPSGIPAGYEADLITATNFKLPKAGDEEDYDKHGTFKVDGAGVEIGNISAIKYLRSQTITSWESIYLQDGTTNEKVFEVNTGADADAHIYLRDNTTGDVVGYITSRWNYTSYFKNSLILGSNTKVPDSGGIARSEPYVCTSSFYIDSLLSNTVNANNVTGQYVLFGNADDAYGLTDCKTFWDEFKALETTVEGFTGATSLSERIVANLKKMQSPPPGTYVPTDTSISLTYANWQNMTHLDQDLSSTRLEGPSFIDMRLSGYLYTQYITATDRIQSSTYIKAYTNMEAVKHSKAGHSFVFGATYAPSGENFSSNLVRLSCHNAHNVLDCSPVAINGKIIVQIKTTSSISGAVFEQGSVITVVFYGDVMNIGYNSIVPVTGFARIRPRDNNSHIAVNEASGASAVMFILTTIGSEVCWVPIAPG